MRVNLAKVWKADHSFKRMLADVESGKDNVDYVLDLSCHDLEEMLQMFYRHCRKCRIMGLILSV